MRFPIRFTGIWRFVWIPIGFVITTIGSSVVQNSVDKTVADAQVNTSLWPILGAAATWLLANWWGVAGWVAFATLVLAALFTYLDDKAVRATRILEYYSIHLLHHRRFALMPERTREDLVEIRRWLDEARGDLINHMPKVFTPATIEAFRAPAVFHTVQAQRETEGMTEQDMRVNIICNADHLLSAIAHKWQAYGGLKKDRP